MDDKLNEILIDLFELEPGQIADTLTAEEVELWDSLNHLKLVTAVEEAFGVQLSMEEIEAIDSVGRLRATLAQHA
ncbi:MAG: acyl carrier protein [Minwuiales bacterium]|nr:acyl carrier protein [Minwuiales bacterium]